MRYGRTSANENYVCKTDDRLKDGDDEWINKEIKDGMTHRLAGNQSSFLLCRFSGT